jgi:hypothetical protein
MKPGLLIHEWRRTFACWSLAMATAFAYVLWEHSPLRTTTIPLALVGALVGIVTAWALFTEPRACAVFTFSGGLSSQPWCLAQGCDSGYRQTCS